MPVENVIGQVINNSLMNIMSGDKQRIIWSQIADY